MKSKLLMLVTLLILPLSLYFSVSYLKQFQGPYFYGTNSDPDYVYLLNSLNVARLKLPGHIDHPGTPVQVIGAITIKLTHIVSGKGKIVNDVLTRPEFYLQILNTVFLILTVITLVITGWIVWRLSKKVEIALLFQMVPLFTIVPELLTKVSTEPTLIITCLLFSVLVLRVFIKEDLDERKNSYLFGFAILSAFGVATKITFFPLILVPIVLLKAWSDKFYFSVIFAITFCILAFPLVFQWEYFRDWLKGLFFGVGVYGSGKQTIIDTASFLQNLLKILSTEFVFDIILLGVIILLIAFFFYYPLKEYRKHHPTRFKIIFFSAAVFSVYLVIISKHYHYRYMIPPIIFSSVTLLGGTMIVQDVFQNLKLLKGVSIVFIATIIFYQVYSFQETTSQLKYDLLGQNELLSLIDKRYHSGIKIYSYGSSSPEQAFSLALGYSYLEQSTYTRVLKNKYPNTYFFSLWDKTFFQWVPSKHIDIEKTLKGEKEVYLHLSNLEENGLALDGKLPILNLATRELTGKFLYLKNLNKEKGYRETIYKLEKIGE
jgi:hypothetical protein